MNLEFNIQDILATDMSSVEPRLFVRGPRDHRERDRLYEKHECQYRMLKWLTWQFNHIEILDLGTRAGTSAFCLADNPANEVLACDITYIHKGVDVEPFLTRAGIDVFKGSVMDLSDDTLLNATIISLDIDHKGYTERLFLNRLKEIGFSGYVIMDDVNFPRRFKRLHEVWLEIDLPKMLLPREIAHDTGTGIVAFGSNSFSVVLPIDESKG